MMKRNDVTEVLILGHARHIMKAGPVVSVDYDQRVEVQANTAFHGYKDISDFKVEFGVVEPKLVLTLWAGRGTHSWTKRTLNLHEHNPR